MVGHPAKENSRLAVAGAAPAHLLTCCHPIPPSPILQLADYFIRWWTRDHYQKYSPDCEGLCGGQFYVQYYGILGLVSVCSTCSGGQPSFPVLPCLHAGTSTASLLAFIPFGDGCHQAPSLASPTPASQPHLHPAPLQLCFIGLMIPRG